MSFIFFSCGDEDELSGPTLTGNEETFSLNAIAESGTNGTVTFSERSDNSTLVTIELTGIASGGDHPAHIHLNTAAEGGGIAIDLTNVDGATGMSETEIIETNDGTPITFSELIDFDGYVNVHESSSNLSTLLAQGDIGQNALTGTSEVYALSAVGGSGVSGHVTFSERNNGETLIVIDLEGDAAGTNHPSHIHLNTAAEGGGVAISLSNVSSGFSRTNVSQLNDGNSITYDELIDFDGYVNVHLSPDAMSTLVSQGDIGQNALTGNSTTYTLNSVSDPAISGEAVFSERKNGETLVMINLVGTTAGGDHPSHIHMNSAAEGGSVAIGLSNVNGTTGVSKTNVTQLNNGTAIDYTGLTQFDGHINVHKSSAEITTLIAQGNVGSNM